MLDLVINVAYISCENPDCCNAIEVSFPQPIQRDDFIEISNTLKKNYWIYFRGVTKIKRYWVWHHFCPKCHSVGNAFRDKMQREEDEKYQKKCEIQRIEEEKVMQQRRKEHEKRIESFGDLDKNGWNPEEKMKVAQGKLRE